LQSAFFRLEEGLRAVAHSAPPNDLARRIVASVLADRRERRYRRYQWAVGASLAAGLLLAVFAGWRLTEFFGGPSGSEQQPVVKNDNPPSTIAPTPSLTDNVEEIGVALAEIWNRTADSALEPGRVLLPATVSIPPMPEGSALTGSLESPVAAWIETGHEVTSFGPVARLGQLFNYVKKELEPLDSSRKSGS
jgi:hypothetical protein